MRSGSGNAPNIFASGCVHSIEFPPSWKRLFYCVYSVSIENYAVGDKGATSKERRVTLVISFSLVRLYRFEMPCKFSCFPVKSSDSVGLTCNYVSAVRTDTIGYENNPSGGCPISSPNLFPSKLIED